MATTLQSTVDWARTFTKLMPIVGVGGFSNEPALSICNQVLQEILSPPFAWKFNRTELATFNTVDKQQDYTIAGVLDISWLEECVMEDTDSTDTPLPTRDIEAVRDLPKTSLVEKPIRICKLKEVGADTVLRFWPIPGTFIETANVVYQAKPPIKTALTNNWSPVPDDLQWLVRLGFLAWALKHADDARANNELRDFRLAIARGAGKEDAEAQHEGFYPARSLMIG